MPRTNLRDSIRPDMLAAGTKAKIIARYGTTLRIWDNRGASFDRYTIMPPRWAKRDYCAHGTWDAIASSEHPFHPQGFGQHTTAKPGTHLGRRIAWGDLPPDVQQFARQSFPEFCPSKD